MMEVPFDRSVLAAALERMDIADIAQATIRQSGDIARIMERETGAEFLHREMGVPGLPPERIGVEAECAALRRGVASQYPNMYGIPELKEQAARFLKAFLDIDVAPQGCIPTVGSMQGSFTTFLLCSQLNPARRKILFIDPGFPVQRSQVRILDIPSESFDIYEYRAEKLGPKIESYLRQGDVAAIVYSNPNNPARICLTEEELRTIGELATRYDAIVIEDLAYLCMDFRKPLGRPFEPPYQATVARYTKNYILMLSGSKIFSYAGQRIATVVISDELYRREYPGLRQRFNMGRLGDAYVLMILYAASSGTSHSAQHALAAMFRAAADGNGHAPGPQTLDGVALHHIGALHQQTLTGQHLCQRTHGHAADAGQVDPDTGLEKVFEIHCGMHHIKLPPKDGIALKLLFFIKYIIIRIKGKCNTQCLRRRIDYEPRTSAKHP